jgi:hypothetical protein
MTFGVTSSGFVKKTLPDILASLRAAQHASPEIGPSMDLSDLAPLGQVNGTVGSEISELWEMGQEAFASFDPEQAADYALTALSSLTGTPRRTATASVSPVTLTLDAGADVPAGSLIAVDGRPDILFALDERVQNLTASPADFDTTATCTQPGPVAANAGSLTVIVNAVSGWTAVTNATDAEQGRVADSDITLRQRRADQLALRGGSTIAAIRADLLDVETHPELDGISEVLVLENTTDSYSVEGLPPHSFEVVLDDGVVPTVDDGAIAQSIFETRPAGIPSFGSVAGDAVDENGDTRVEHFSRADLLDVYVDLTLTTGPNYPADGDDQVRAAIVAKGSELKIGGDVIALQIRAAALSVSGVTDVPTFAIGFSASPTLSDNLTVGTRQRAVFDTSRITGL